MLFFYKTITNKLILTVTQITCKTKALLSCILHVIKEELEHIQYIKIATSLHTLQVTHKLVDKFCFCYNRRNVKQILNDIMFNSKIFLQHIIVHEKHNS